MNVVKLSNTQIEKLNDFIKHFPGIDLVEIIEDNSTGIGGVVTVKFESCGIKLIADITEVDRW